MVQFRTPSANRQHFSHDKRAITMFGREEFKPVMKHHYRIEALLFIIGR